MARQRSLLADYLVYVVVRLGLCGIQACPERLADRVADLLGWLAYRLDARHRRVAQENLRHAFPDWTDDQRERVAQGSFRHLLHLVIEISRLPRKLSVRNWRNYVTLIGGGRVVHAMLDSRPALLVTGHLGNWELAGYALGLLGFHTSAIARTLDNLFLDRYLRRFRQKTGQRILAKKGEFDEITRVLGQGGVLATLADQDAGQRGLFVEFFGRPASTHKAIALLALQFDAPLVVVGVPRIRHTSRHFHVVVEDVIDPRHYTNRPDAVTIITQCYTQALERLIRQYPEQYFWMHRRWKHQPKSATGRSAA
jgi:KDO2-lipid IV(A) lauroyltransferase